MSPAGTDNARLAALKLLAAVLDRGQNLGDNEPGPATLQPRDLAFARHLAFGVLRWLAALEWLTGQLLRRPLKERDRDLQRLILIGLFQLWQDERGEHAAVNECAECARRVGKPWAVGVINAVLRRFQRERDQWLARLAEQDDRFAHPPWLLAQLRQDWPQDWETIADADNRAAALWLRLRQDRDPERITDTLRQGGFATTAHAAAPSAVRIEPAAAVDAVPGFSEGLCSVQDPAAQLAAGLLDLRPGQRVLDACAAPGGKTGHILEVAPAVELWALDRSPGRLEKVRENLRRLGFLGHPGLRLLAADASEPAAWWDGQPFDRILLDAPCSATGVIRRHPEIKWLRSPAQVAEAVALQAVLLRQLWPLLRPGGILLYATCSMLKDENCRQIERFAGSCPDATPNPIDAGWGRASGPGRQILPGEQDMDGFYYARLFKT